MKNKVAYFLLCLGLIVLNPLILSTGNKTEAAPANGLPTVTTAPATNIRSTWAMLGGTLTNDGGNAIAARGVVLSLHHDPTLNDELHNAYNSGIGVFSIVVTTLMRNTTYYVRAYATNSSGTAYGNEISFTTPDVTMTLATVNTNVATNIGNTSAMLGGNVTNDGGSDVWDKGVVWGIHNNPVLGKDDGKPSTSRGNGGWSQDIQGIFPNTTYFVRAYANNITGTAYGNEISFATASPPPEWAAATVTTNIATNIGETAITLGGNVTNDGHTAVILKGVAIGIHHNPGIANGEMRIPCGYGLGAWSFNNCRGFIPNTTYYARAFATNSLCTAYGNEISFTTTGGGGGGCNVIMVTNDITAAITWSKGNVYIVGGSISVDATLTIEPGTIIKFRPGAGINTRRAGIHAVGTAADSIIFKAYSDDSYCGDNNGDGGTSLATKGFWGGIRFQAHVPSYLAYCRILYAGCDNPNAAGTDEALIITDASDGSTFRNCTIAHTSGGSKITRGAVIFDEIYNCVFTNNALYDNGAPIVADYCASANFLAASNIFHNPDNPAQKNVLQGIFLNRQNSGFEKNTRLTVTEVPYVINGINGAGISRGMKVTLADGVIVKFLPGAELDLYSNNNSGIINGQGPGVLFTSFADDTGGDSNGDDNLSSPANSDWKGIYDKDAAIWLSRPNIKFGSH